jgi:hypothetical protein
MLRCAFWNQFASIFLYSFIKCINRCIDCGHREGIESLQPCWKLRLQPSQLVGLYILQMYVICSNDMTYRAVITGIKSQYNSISDLRDTTIGISRYGRSELPLSIFLPSPLIEFCSGSQIMAYVMAMQCGWPTNLKFQGRIPPPTSPHTSNLGSLCQSTTTFTVSYHPSMTVPLPPLCGSGSPPNLLSMLVKLVL